MLVLFFVKIFKNLLIFTRRKDSSRVWVNGFGKSTAQKAVWANKKYVANSKNSVIIKLTESLARKERNVGVFSELKIPMQKRYVLSLCKKYGIDTTGISFKIQRSEELAKLGYFGLTDYNNIGRIDLLPSAFRNEEQLLRTIIHEKCHIKQLKKYGKKYVQDNIDKMERVAYRFENIFYAIIKKRVIL